MSFASGLSTAGGDVLFSVAGDDATEVFTAFHPPSAFLLFDQFYIGDLVESTVTGKHSKEKERTSETAMPVRFSSEAEREQAVLEDFRQVRLAAKKMKLFHARYVGMWKYVFKRDCPPLIRSRN